MKVIIRNLSSHSYYAGNGTWLPDPARARQFPDAAAAARFALANRLAHVFVIVRFERPDCELSFPPAQLAA